VIVRLTACTVDLVRDEVHRDGATVALTPREAELLRYLVDHPRQVVDRSELLSEVWRFAPTAVTRACDNTVRRLREKVEVDPAKPDHVLTVHGTGYRFEPTARAPVVAERAPVSLAVDTFRFLIVNPRPFLSVKSR
jgi:DNA-binding response OmpR family regulator